MKKVFLFVLILAVMLSCASCTDKTETSNESEKQQIDVSTEASVETSDTEPKKSVLEMTDEELKELYDDISALDLENKTGELNYSMKIDIKQTGLTKSYEITANEKTSIRDDGTMKRAYSQKMSGYMLEANTEYIFDDGIAYIYADYGKFKAPCNLDEFRSVLSDSGNENFNPDSTMNHTMKAIEETDEYVVLEATAVSDEQSTEYVKDMYGYILSMLTDVDEYDDFTLVSGVQTTKIAKDFVESIEESIKIKFSFGETEFEVKIDAKAEYSTKDPIITVPEDDNEYFELPKINTLFDLSDAVEKFMYSDFISFVQKTDLNVNSKSENFSANSTEHVMAILPNGVLKYKIVNEGENQGIKYASVTTYNGTKYETTINGEKESLNLDQDEAYAVLSDYYSTFWLADIYGDIVGVKEKNGNIFLDYEIGDEMFNSIALNLIYSIFTDPANVEMKDAVAKNVHYTIKDSLLINAGYDLEFTCVFESELYTLKCSLELSDVRQLDENTKDLDI